MKNKQNIDFSLDLINKPYREHLHNETRTLIFYGGAGSGKSFFVAQRLILKWLEGDHNFLVVRKTAKTSRHSTFALIKQIMKAWDVPPAWYTINKSEMTITNNINKSQIMFAGLDDVEKLKSLTFESGVLTDIWIEEASEITEEDYSQLNLRLRGLAKVPFQIVLTFNPISALSWLKKKFFDRESSTVQHFKTTYKDNGFIDDAYKAEIEALKTSNPELYKIYGLGEWGILGNLIYTNFIIHDFDYSQFDDISAGLDFGFNHPSAFLDVRFHDDDVYVCDELHEAGLTNPELIAKVIKQFGYEYLITADSAEPARIVDFKKADFRIEGAVKGKDSVKHGIDWLKSRTIHIHSGNCPGTAGEIGQYCWKKDREGNILDEPVNFKDDAMAALRYACEKKRLDVADFEPIVSGRRTF